MAKHDKFGWVGQVIDAKYRVDRAVDEGTFGVVYQAHHLGFDEKVALKCLKLPQGLSGPVLEEFCRRFLAEGRFLHRLSRANANIVQALDVGAELMPGGAWVPYLVLEWLEGISLAEDLEQRASRGETGRGLEAAIALLEPAALALAAAHEQRVFHCDVKPANLFLTKVAGRPTLKVLDFGIAKFADEAGHESGADGEALCAFSPFYAAPEQFDRSYGAPGSWTDLFSLALVLVEVASGRPALEGRSIAELFRTAIDPEERPTLRARGVACSEAVEEVLRRALCPRPDGRFANALDFWQALTRAANVRPAVSHDVALTTSSSPAKPSGVEAELPASGGFLSDAEGTAASTGAHPASRESPTPPKGAAKALRRGRRVGQAVAMASGAALALAVTHHGLLPDLHAASSLQSIAPLASHLDGSTALGLGLRLLSRFDATSSGLPSSSAPNSHLAGAALEAPSLAGGAPASRAASAAADPEGASDFTLRELGLEASLDYPSAARACAEGGMALCTEAQWQIACSAHAPLGGAESWTASSPGAPESATVHGGREGCAMRRSHRATETLRTRGQICCAPALVGEPRAAFTPASLATPSRP